MTYELIRFMFYTAFIIVIIYLMRKYIMKVTHWILKEGNFSIEVENNKTVKDVKHIKIARIVFIIIGIAIMTSAYLPIKDHVGAFSFDLVGITSIIATIIILLLGITIIIFTNTNKFERKFNSIVRDYYKYNYSLIEIKNEDNSILENVNNIKSYIFNHSIIKHDNELDDEIDDVDPFLFKKDLDPTFESLFLFNKKSITQESIEDFELLVENKKLKKRVEWISEADKSKLVEYKSLFSYLHVKLKNGIYPISTQRRKELCIFISSSFYKKGKDFKPNRVNRVYGEWLDMQSKD